MKVFPHSFLARPARHDVSPAPRPFPVSGRPRASPALLGCCSAALIRTLPKTTEPPSRGPSPSLPPSRQPGSAAAITSLVRGGCSAPFSRRTKQHGSRAATGSSQGGDSCSAPPRGTCRLPAAATGDAPPRRVIWSLRHTEQRGEEPPNIHGPRPAGGGPGGRAGVRGARHPRRGVAWVRAGPGKPRSNRIYFAFILSSFSPFLIMLLRPEKMMESSIAAKGFERERSADANSSSTGQRVHPPCSLCHLLLL